MFAEHIQPIRAQHYACDRRWNAANDRPIVTTVIVTTVGVTTV
jgi:hypothetical protein